jgi:maltooligosyltrehalose trehalohydrolase
MNDYQPIRPSALGPTRNRSGSWEFVVWAPLREKVELHFASRELKDVPMERVELGYHRAHVEHVVPGSKYAYRLDGITNRPDPASRFQPEGVHGPSEVVDPSEFRWTDIAWKAPSLADSVFYELHVGTFTKEGSLTAIIPHLDRLADLGVTTIELMPLAQFPGTRNWGYDGTFPFSPQNSYGSPQDLQKLVDAAHAKNLGVALDVVFNHLGPEGNYLSEYGPYFTDFYRTPWGSALNFDGPHSDEVRFFFIQSALYWLEHFHIDALRLDAVHSIYDASAFPFLAELSAAVEALSTRLGRKILLIAESDQNDARIVSPIESGGMGMDAQWSDDFHHSVHTLLTGETSGYYGDFGDLHHLAMTVKNGWYYAGQYSCHRQRRHGNAAPKCGSKRFVACTQNHDQVGNRAMGDRLSTLVSFESLKLAAGISILSSFVPLLFMGEEYGETAPFLYFTSHGDAKLAEAVRRGRQAEFAHFQWQGEIPDPQADSTFARSKLNHALAGQDPHRTLLRFYKTLLRFRHDLRLAEAQQISITEYPLEQALLTLRAAGPTLLAGFFHFGETTASIKLELPDGKWETKIDSAGAEWLGQGTSFPNLLVNGSAQISMQARSFILLERSSPLME